MASVDDNEQLITSETPRLWTQYFAAFAVSLGALAAGTILGWTSPAEIPVEQGAFGFPVTKDEFGWIGAIVTLGAASICYPITLVLWLMGNKVTMLILIIPFLLGWSLIYYSTSVSMIYIGRFLAGVAGGAFCVTVPLYTSEIASKEIRGSLGSFFQLFVTMGILFVDVAGFYYDIVTVTAICGFIPLVFGVLLVMQPDSPVYYVKCGNLEKAKTSLKYFRGENYNIDAELNEILNRNADPIVSSYREILSTKAAKKSIALCFGLMFIQQFSGINAIIFYASSIFKSANIGISPDAAVIIIAALQVISTVITSIIVDKAGRRILLLISAFVMSACTGTLALYFHYPWSDKIPWLPVILLSVFLIAYSLGFGPVPWVVLNEIVPKELGTGVSSAACTFCWGLAFLITKFYGLVSREEYLGVALTYAILSLLTMFGFCFVLVLLPETKGRSLTEIQCLLNGDDIRLLNGESGTINEAFNSDNNN